MDNVALRKWRERAAGIVGKRRMTQQDAADLFGVNWSTYNRWESGETEPVSWKMVGYTCAALLHGLPPFKDHESESQ